MHCNRSSGVQTSFGGNCLTWHFFTWPLDLASMSTTLPNPKQHMACRTPIQIRQFHETRRWPIAASSQCRWTPSSSNRTFPSGPRWLEWPGLVKVSQGEANIENPTRWCSHSALHKVVARKMDWHELVDLGLAGLAGRQELT